MTHIYFKTEPGVYLMMNSYDSNSIPRVGEEVCLRILEGSLYKSFVVEKVSWYEARDPGEGLEVEIQLGLCEQ